MKKALIFVLALVLLVGVFAACGGNEEQTSGNPPATTTTQKKGETTTPKKTDETTTSTTVSEEVDITTEPYTKVVGITRDPSEVGEYTGGGYEGPLDPNPNED